MKATSTPTLCLHHVTYMSHMSASQVFRTCPHISNLAHTARTTRGLILLCRHMRIKQPPCMRPPPSSLLVVSHDLKSRRLLTRYSVQASRRWRASGTAARSCSTTTIRSTRWVVAGYLLTVPCVVGFKHSIPDDISLRCGCTAKAPPAATAARVSRIPYPPTQLHSGS